MPVRSAGRAAGGGIVAIGLAVAAWRAQAPGAEAPTGFLIVNAVLVLIGALFLAAGAVRLLRAPATGEPLSPGPAPVAAPALLGVVLGTGLVVLTPHLGLVFTGVAVTGWSAWLLRRGAELSAPAPLAPALTLLLIPAFWFLATIAGPESLAVANLAALPVSPAAERLLAPVLLLVTWALGGLWPLQGQIAGPLAAPAGAILLHRIGLALVPAGLAHWRAAFFPLLVVGIWHAALTRRLAGVAVGAGLLGIASLDPDGIAGGGWLLATAAALEALRRAGTGSRLARVPLVLAATWGGIQAATGGLRAEVVYTVLAVAGAGWAITARAPSKGTASVSSPSTATR